MSFLVYFRKLKLNILAQLYGQATAIGIQLLLVPVLLSAWSVDVYGVWLVISAVPTYISMTDLGLTFVAKNEMTIAVARRDRASAIVTYQTVFNSLLALTALTMAAGFVIFSFVDLSRLFNFASVPAQDAALALVLLSFNALLYQYLLLDCAGIRCIGRNVTEVTLASTARLLDGIIVGVVALSGGGIVAVAVSVLSSRLIFNSAVHFWLWRVSGWLTYGVLHSSRRELSRIIGPAFSMVMATVSNALMIQGPVIVLGAVAKPEDVATFSVLRTLARTGMAAANVISHATSAEYSILFGRQDIVGAKELLRRHLTLVFGVIVCYISGMFLAAGPIIDGWTHGTISLIQPLFNYLVYAVAVEMAFTTLFYILTTRTQHAQVAYIQLILAISAASFFSTVIAFSNLNGLGALLFFINTLTLFATIGIFLGNMKT